MIKVLVDDTMDFPEHILLKMPKVVLVPVKPRMAETEYTNIFEKELEAGFDVIYVSISSQFNKNVKNARQAIEKLSQKFKNKRIINIDTCTISLAAGYLAYYVYRQVEQGIKIDEIKQNIDNHKISKYVFISVKDVATLQKRGVAEKEILSGGSSLNRRDILTISPSGKVKKFSQVSGPKKAVFELTDLVYKFGRNVADHRVAIIYSGNIQKAFDVKNTLLERFSIENNIDIVKISSELEKLTGKDVVGIIFNGKKVR